jgi:hypothetical protein
MIGWTVLMPFAANAGPPKVISSASAPDLDKLLHRTDGWIGGDGAYSVECPSKRLIWLFSDTWVGKLQDGRRTDATIVNNTIGIQENATASPQYFINRDEDGKPTAAIVPVDNRGWFWLQSGLLDGRKLMIFLNQVERNEDSSVFGFQSTGLWLGTVTDAEQPPQTWHVNQIKLLNTIFQSNRILVWGAATVRLGDDVYIYGTDEIRDAPVPKRAMILARVNVSSLSDISTWRYFHDGQWVKDFRDCTHLAMDFATEFSVTPFEKGYLAVYTHQGLSPKIMGRTSDNPWGPWSDPAVLHASGEMSRDKNLFCYGAKAQPALSSDHEIVVTYFVNSFDFWQIAREADLYWPRFVRVKLADSAD